MMHRTPTLLALMLSAALLLAGCGQKGDLFLPDGETRAATATDLGHDQRL